MANTGNNQTNDDNTSNSTTTSAETNTPEIVITANKNRNTNTKPTVGKRTWNPLGDFSSYTYRISLYALSLMHTTRINRQVNGTRIN